MDDRYIVQYRDIPTIDASSSHRMLAKVIAPYVSDEFEVSIKHTTQSLNEAREMQIRHHLNLKGGTIHLEEYPNA